MTNRKFHTIALLSIGLGFILFILDFSDISYVKKISNAVNTLTSPILKFKEQITSELKEEIGAYFHRVDVEKENIKLRKRINSLLLTEKELEACLSELNKLSKKIKLKDKFRKLKYSISRVVYYDPSGFDLFIIINGGKDKGFREGDLVVTEVAVVGIIEAVFGTTSRVITPLNENFSSSVVISGKRKKYIYKGGYPTGDLLHVNVEDKVKKGDKVFFSDPKRRIPSFLIGQIVQVERGENPFFRKVKVKPAVDPRTQEYIFVIGR